MNGILSTQPQGILGQGGQGMSPQDAALLQFAMSMMAGSGPSAMPKNLGQIMGQAGMQGMQTYQQGVQQQQTDAMNREKMDLMRAEATRKATPEPFTLVPGARRIGPDGKVIAEAPFKPAESKDSPLAALIRERDALPPNSPHRAIYEDAIKKATTHQPPTTTVDLRQDTEFNKAVGKEFGDQYAGLMRADMNAPATIGKYNRLGQLLSSVNTGKFKGTTTELKAAAKSLGMDLTALGVADDVAPAQAARALSNQLALEMRNPSGGAGMPGALSDKDREFLVQSLPTLESDPSAIGKMIEYRVKLAKREQQVARMARAYRKKHGKFDEGFFDELQTWSDKNPLFNEAPAAAPKVIDFGSLK